MRDIKLPPSLCQILSSKVGLRQSSAVRSFEQQRSLSIGGAIGCSQSEGAGKVGVPTVCSWPKPGLATSKRSTAKLAFGAAL